MFTQTQLKKFKMTAKAVSSESGATYQQALELQARELGYKTYHSLKDDASGAPAKSKTQDANQFDTVMLSLPESLADYRVCLQLSEHNGFLEVYAPFEFVNHMAKVAIVGLTPGDLQARNAITAYKEARKTGSSEEQALKAAKMFASFSGPMRKNLVNLLDHIGVNELLSIPTSGELFNSNSELAHFTSLLRNPVYFHGRNYSGTPSPANNRFLWGLVKSRFLKELEKLPDVIWIPLGAAVKDSFKRMINEKQIDPARVLLGLPHPSGANMERINYFLEEKSREALSNRTDPDSLDLARKQLVDQVKDLYKGARK